MEKNKDISILIPVFNEKDNIHELYNRISNSLKSVCDDFEIIFVDDGSLDGSFEEIKKLAKVRGIRLKRNYGQSHALACGIKNARGRIIVTIDGDLENYPEDIPQIINKINEGYDVVKGWRKDRWNKNYLIRKIPSIVANKAISSLSRLKLHDHGCGLAAFKAEILKDFIFSDDIHRMIIPYLVLYDHIDVCEVEVRFSPRKSGKSKYGFSRTFGVLLDLFSYLFFKNYARKPMHFFGNAGLFIVFLGILTFFYSFYLKVSQGINFNKTPLPVLVAIFVVIGFQFILMGFLGEIIVRTLRKNEEQDYKVAEKYEGK